MLITPTTMISAPYVYSNARVALTNYTQSLYGSQMRQKYKNCVLMKSLSENCSPEFLHYKIVLVVELMCKAYGWSWEEQTISGG